MGKKKKKNTDENSGHYVIASSRLPERRPLERRKLVPIDRLRAHVLTVMFRNWALKMLGNSDSSHMLATS